MTYDSLGNRLSDSNSTYLYDETKQQIQEDYKYLYSFDANGNMTSKQEKGFTGNVQNFDYDSENQLRYFHLYKNGVLVKEVQYLYDALGRRVEKTIIDHEDSSRSYTKRFAYDGSEILFEMDGDNVINKTYTHSTMRTDDVLSVATTNNSYFFLKDGLGTITDITDSTGFKVQHHEYTSFGQLASVTDSTGNDIKANPVLDPYFTYTGREYDEESGLYYYRARYYDSAIGRFLQIDPDVGVRLNPITLVNRYIYVGNNPILNKDPSGKIFGIDDAYVVGIILLGGAIQAGMNMNQSQKLGFGASSSKFWLSGITGFLTGAGQGLVGASGPIGSIFGTPVFSFLNNIFNQAIFKGGFDKVDYKEGFDTYSEGMVSSIASYSVFSISATYLMPYLDIIGKPVPGLSSPRMATSLSFFTGLGTSLNVSSGIPKCEGENIRKYNCQIPASK